jgi:hypothetical protein
MQIEPISPIETLRAVGLCAASILTAWVSVLGARRGRRPWAWGIVGGYNALLLALYAGASVTAGYLQLRLVGALFVVTLPWSVVLYGPVNRALAALPVLKHVVDATDPGLFLFVGVFGGINSLAAYIFLRRAHDGAAWPRGREPISLIESNPASGDQAALGPGPGSSPRDPGPALGPDSGAVGRHPDAGSKAASRRASDARGRSAGGRDAPGDS